MASVTTHEMVKQMVANKNMKSDDILNVFLACEESTVLSRATRNFRRGINKTAKTLEKVTS